MVVHGAGQGFEQLTMATHGRDVSVRFDDNLHDLSLQGPLAVDYLAQHVPGIRDLPYFAHLQTSLFGKPAMISRTGYTGERGYELFVRGQDAPMIWDRILDEGKEMGIIPCRFTTLDMLRTESYLLFFPYDNSEMYPFDNEPGGDTLWELGLDFTVSPGKTGFHGADEHYRLKGKERFKIWGLKLEGDKVPGNGAPVLQDGKQVGVVTQAMHSPLNNWTVAIARLPVALANDGTKLVVNCATHGEIAATTAVVAAISPWVAQFTTSLVPSFASATGRRAMATVQLFSGECMACVTTPTCLPSCSTGAPLPGTLSPSSFRPQILKRSLPFRR